MNDGAGAPVSPRALPVDGHGRGRRGVLSMPSEAFARARRWAAPVAPMWTAVAGRAQVLLGGIRLRLVWWFIVVLALATVGSVVLSRQVLVQALDARIQAELEQEVGEIRRLANDNDPATGQPFAGDVQRIFEVFLERNIPARHEMMLTYIDGELYRHAPARPLYPLHENPAYTPLWTTASEYARGRVDSPVGAVDYIAVPFVVDGAHRGNFVVASFHGLQQMETDAASVGAAIVGLVTLVIGSILAMRLADRILTPVRAVTATARSISETDLSQRIPVSGYDEISELSVTFNDMLERLDAAFATQRRFIDDAGHELRTPITVIRGHLELMDDDAARRGETLRLVSEELDRMTRMVDELLTLARIEQPDFLRLRHVPVDDLTRSMLDNASRLGERTWRLDAVAAGTAIVDEQRLMQAILQLAANAVRHTPQLGDIGIGSAARDGEVRFWVRDSGPGVARDERDRIFERFYRGRSGYRPSDGVGLGLSIVRGIAEAHGGRIEIDTEPGRGARFAIVIPVSGPVRRE
jgi:signal transduction histidine kinase